MLEESICDLRKSMSQIDMYIQSTNSAPNKLFDVQCLTPIIMAEASSGLVPVHGWQLTLKHKCQPIGVPELMTNWGGTDNLMVICVILP